MDILFILYQPKVERAPFQIKGKKVLNRAFVPKPDIESQVWAQII